MNKEQYVKMLSFLRERPRLLSFVLNTQRAITAAVYLFYPCILVYLLIFGDSRFLKVLIVPAVSFALLSAVRYLINAKRPYEVFETPPLNGKKKKGKSCPSRHTFSVFVISFAAFYVCRPLGVVLSALGLLLAVCRVLCGVHFVRDVLLGAASGILCGVVGFYIL